MLHEMERHERPSSGLGRARRCVLRALQQALLAPLLACGSAERVEATIAASQVFEGANFYEPEGGAPAGPLPPPPVVTPSFYEFVTDDSLLATCAAPPSSERPELGMFDASLVCPPLGAGLISDFTFTPGSDPAGAYFTGPSFAGGTFFYPEGAERLASDVSGGDWHLYGTVSTISGFGLYSSGCRQLDASAYRGIAFTVWGGIGDGGGLVFYVGTADNQVSHVWINANKASPSDMDEAPNLGRCTPLASRYDGSCREARVPLTVSSTPTEVQLLWRDFTDGCPQPSVDPSQITAIAWYFPESSAGAYAVDVHIDNLRFTDADPL